MTFGAGRAAIAAATAGAEGSSCLLFQANLRWSGGGTCVASSTSSAVATAAGVCA